MKKLLATLVAVSAVAMASSAFAGIVNSKHDLTAAGGGYKAGNTTQVCVFCHTPHNSARTKALWNRIPGSLDSAFSTYTSGIMMEGGKADTWFVGSKGGLAPKSTSLLCMTCHDGVTKMNALNNQPFDAFNTVLTTADNSGTLASAGRSNLSTNLTNDHPVNITYDTAVTMVNNARTGSLTPRDLTTGRVGVLPFQNGVMECSTCHNVHEPAIAPFLRISIDKSALCLACHNK